MHVEKATTASNRFKTSVSMATRRNSQDLCGNLMARQESRGKGRSRTATTLDRTTRRPRNHSGAFLLPRKGEGAAGGGGRWVSRERQGDASAAALLRCLPGGQRLTWAKVSGDGAGDGTKPDRWRHRSCASSQWRFSPGTRRTRDLGG